MGTNSKIVFVHVPKCGGGTLYKLIKDPIFKDNFHRKKMKNKLSPVDRSTILNQDYTRKPMKVNGENVIFGHFHYSTYSGNLVTIIRNPVDRTISHYYEWLNKGHFNKGKRAPHIKREMMLMKEDIVYFTMKFSNFMTRYFTGNDVKNYKFIGFLENYKQSLNFINDNFFSIDIDKIENTVIHKSNKHKVSDKTRKLISEYLSEDIKFYQEAMNINKTRDKLWKNC